jgi:hypothetical protein
MTQLEIALKIENDKLESQLIQMKQLVSVDGFFKIYFQECKNAKTNQEAFNTVNDLYFNLFGRYRYIDYASFKNVTNYYHKKNKK